MTNAEIIYAERIALAARGKIGFVDGKPEEIHTYNHWKHLGYQVQKGQKAICKLNIWKSVKSHKLVEVNGEEEVQEVSKMTMQRASFFARNQVEAIAKA